MTNEELYQQYKAGDSTALETLYQQNGGLIQRLAVKCAGDFGYRRQAGKPSAFMDDLIDELCAEGSQAFCSCVAADGYDETKGKLTTYLVPFLKGAMYRWLEDLKERRLHTISVYDLVPEDDGRDPLEYISGARLGESADSIVNRKISLELLRGLFDRLSDKDKSILGYSFGAFGYEKLTLDEIALQELLTVDGVVKVRKNALQHLQDAYPGSGLEVWRRVRKVLRETSG